MRTRFLPLLALVTLIASPSLGEDRSRRSGDVHGRVVFEVGGIDLTTMGPTVVFLDTARGDLVFETPKAVLRISQKNAQFEPPFLVVARGQTVEMPNDDTIFHNVFSFSKPNELDLGLYPNGERRSVTFREAGVVRLYCSIHESMNATIFVAPSPYHAMVEGSGAFEIHEVPAGAYRIRSWNEKLPEASAELEVAPGRTVAIDLRIGTEGASR